MVQYGWEQNNQDMKQRQNINLKLPIFSWLFFLFLSSGISYYNNNLQFGKRVQIERVDQLISNSYKKKSVAEFSVFSKKSTLHRRLNSQFLRTNLLSKRLNNYVHIVLNRQSFLFRLIIQNTVLHFESRNRTSNTFDDFPDFIS